MYSCLSSSYFNQLLIIQHVFVIKVGTNNTFLKRFGAKSHRQALEVSIEFWSIERWINMLLVLVDVIKCKEWEQILCGTPQSTFSHIPESDVNHNFREFQQPCRSNCWSLNGIIKRNMLLIPLEGRLQGFCSLPLYSQLKSNVVSFNKAWRTT